jgi:hypothetical protein
MSDKSNRLSRFWEELKRRKVIKVIAMYAATAFIIIEAGDIMLPRLGLPDWTVTFIIILLIIGFPIAIIFSWIFDITPEGLKKTEPAKAKSEIDSKGSVMKMAGFPLQLCLLKIYRGIRCIMSGRVVFRIF